VTPWVPLELGSAAAEAQAARAQVEDAIDARGGRYSRPLSLLLDPWILVEEVA
jgi:hypothetical protein